MKPPKTWGLCAASAVVTRIDGGGAVAPNAGAQAGPRMRPLTLVCSMAADPLLRAYLISHCTSRSLLSAQLSLEWPPLSTRSVGAPPAAAGIFNLSVRDRITAEQVARHGWVERTCPPPDPPNSLLQHAELDG